MGHVRRIMYDDASSLIIPSSLSLAIIKWTQYVLEQDSVGLIRAGPVLLIKFAIHNRARMTLSLRSEHTPVSLVGNLSGHSRKPCVSFDTCIV